MIAQRAEQDTQDQLNDSNPADQYEEMRRIADAMLYWAEKARREGLWVFEDIRYERDWNAARRLGLTGNR